MVAPIRKTVIVGRNGDIELRRSGLPPGSRAQVIVLPLTSQSASEFFDSLTIDELAAKQQVKPSNSFDDMLGGWPSDELEDGFATAIARWRRIDESKSKRSR